MDLFQKAPSTNLPSKLKKLVVENLVNFGKFRRNHKDFTGDASVMPWTSI